MSEWRLHRPERKKDSLLAKIVLYLCLVLAPAGIGGCMGAYYYMLPPRRMHEHLLARDTAPGLQRRFRIGALAGGIFGAGACVYFTIAARRQRP